MSNFHIEGCNTQRCITGCTWRPPLREDEKAWLEGFKDCVRTHIDRADRSYVLSIYAQIKDQCAKRYTEGYCSSIHPMWFHGRVAACEVALGFDVCQEPESGTSQTSHASVVVSPLASLFPASLSESLGLEDPMF